LDPHSSLQRLGLCPPEFGSEVGTEVPKKLIINSIKWGSQHRAFFWGVQVYFLAVLGFELRALCLLGRHSYHLNHSISRFVLGIFEIGSYKLFAQAGFEPRSS
jgi:hypothetical protein